MTRLVLDKNPEPKLDENIDDVKKTIEQNVASSVTYSDPFLKTIFFTKIVPSLKKPIIYLDFDLLYSGYVTSGMIPVTPDVTLLQPTQENWNEMFKNILQQISQVQTTIIIDSINGFYNMFYEINDVGRLVNSFIMLIIGVAKMSNSHFLFGSLVKRKEKEHFVLSDTGRQIIDAKQMTKINLNKKNSFMEISVSSKTKLNEKQTFVFKSELF